MKKTVSFVGAWILTSLTLMISGCTRVVSNMGSPWIDSDIQEYVKSVKRPSPKDDFNLSVNYDWILKAKIPDGEARYASFTEAGNDVDEKVLALLKDEPLSDHDSQLVHHLYNAILDWNERKTTLDKHILPVVQEIKGIKTIDELSDFLCTPERSFLIPSLMNIGNTTSFDDSSSYITGIYIDGFTLEDAAEYRNRTETGNRYEKAKFHIIEAVALRLGYTKDEIKAMFDSVLEFEGKIAEKALTAAEEMEPDYIKRINNEYEPEKAYSLATRFPLARFVDVRGYGNAKKFLVPQPETIKRVDELYTDENLEAIKTYMLVHTMHIFASYLDEEIEKVIAEAENIASGTRGRMSEDKRASYIVRNMLPTPIARAYLVRYDMSDLKKRIKEICQEVISVYRDMLTEEEWLSEETRAKAVEKLDTITIKSVYPDKWIDFSPLNLDGLSYFESVRAIAKFAQDLDRSHTNQKVDKELFAISDILQQNAFYEPSENSINMILGLLAYPFYYEGMSQEALLGTVGSVIGHEISHAFDTNGAQFDKNGNLVNWWTESDYVAFQNRAEKLIAYFDNITALDGEKVQGKNIQTEAIADMAGIKAVLRIAKKITNFDYKIFFEAYAGNWRGINTREYEQYRMQFNPHPLNYLRTNVTLQQFDEFYETFGVKEGDGMYLAPENRILVW